MKTTQEGLLIVISGPSGVGKGTVISALLERNPNMKLSVSATTRSPRPGEVEGVDYFFKSNDEFSRMIENGEFLEYMHVYGANYYGTPKSYVEEEMRQGMDIILEIDVKGAMKIKEENDNALLIFLMPPSMSALKTRLYGRGSETNEVIDKRFEAAFAELKFVGNYDYVIVNDYVVKAVSSVESIISAERCKVSRNKDIVCFNE